MVGAGEILLAAWAVALIIFDVRFRRLPDVLTVPAAFCCLGIVVFCDHAIVVGYLWPALYLFFGRGIGGGDIKLACSLGVFAAWANGFLAVACAVALSSIFSLILALVFRNKEVPHGPAMLGATWLVAIS